jgi:hypothetical protein
MDLFLNISRILILIFFLVILYFIVYIIYILYLKYEIKENEDAVQKNCKLTRWGCCPDKLTPRLDPDGTNCRGF